MIRSYGSLFAEVIQLCQAIDYEANEIKDIIEGRDFVAGLNEDLISSLSSIESKLENLRTEIE